MAIKDKSKELGYVPETQKGYQPQASVPETGGGPAQEPRDVAGGYQPPSTSEGNNPSNNPPPKKP